VEGAAVVSGVDRDPHVVYAKGLSHGLLIAWATTALLLFALWAS
jgi:hypothetical protein